MAAQVRVLKAVADCESSKKPVEKDAVSLSLLRCCCYIAAVSLLFSCYL